MKTSILLFVAIFVAEFALAQRIDAPVISEWKSLKKLSQDYKLNSVSVLLLNGNLLPDLFSGEFLTRRERRRNDLHSNDYAKYLYLSLDVPTPNKDNEILHFPLYLIDARNKESKLFSTNEYGRVVDEIKDEELDYKPLDATGVITAIKGNSANELTAEILP